MDQLLLLAVQERVAQQLVSPNFDINRIWQNVLGLSSSTPTPSSSTAPQSVYTTRAAPVTTSLATPLDLSSLPSLFSSANSQQQQSNILSSSNTSTASALLSSHQFYQHGICNWPQCGHPCDSFAIFIQHLNQVHIVGERSTRECQEQIELIESLDHRLSKERSRLLAMMHHLHMNPSSDNTSMAINNSNLQPSHYQLTAALQQQNETNLLQAKLSSVVASQKQRFSTTATADNVASLLMVAGNESIENRKMSMDSKQVIFFV